jgi:hypothetical protein
VAAIPAGAAAGEGGAGDVASTLRTFYPLPAVHSQSRGSLLWPYPRLRLGHSSVSIAASPAASLTLALVREEVPAARGGGGGGGQGEGAAGPQATVRRLADGVAAAAAAAVMGGAEGGERGAGAPLPPAPHTAAAWHHVLAGLAAAVQEAAGD